MNVTKELMGHANISTTAKFYSVVDEDHQKKAARVIDKLVGEPPGLMSGADKTDAKVTQ